MTTISTIISGAFHRPPAGQLLRALPMGTRLRLQAEPGNPYDPFALRVLLDPTDVPEALHPDLDAAMQGTGYCMEDLLMSGESVQLGFVAASEGKPRLVAQAQTQLTLAGNREFYAAVGYRGEDPNDGGANEIAWTELEAKLGFSQIEKYPYTVSVEVPE